MLSLQMQSTWRRAAGLSLEGQFYPEIVLPLGWRMWDSNYIDDINIDVVGCTCPIIILKQNQWRFALGFQHPGRFLEFVPAPLWLSVSPSAASPGLSSSRFIFLPSFDFLSFYKCSISNKFHMKERKSKAGSVVQWSSVWLACSP